MKITDMNIDCLENCLEYLSLIDLLNAADSNKRLRHAARYVFVRIYSKRKVHLSLIKLMNKIWNGSQYKSGVVSNITGKLLFYDLKKGLQFLLCFGDLFSEIDMEFPHKDGIYAIQRDQRYGDVLIQLTKSIEWESIIIEYINEYCSDSLINFKITDSPKGCFDKLTKPFEKIEKFETVGCEPIFSNENKLNHFFPKIQRLKLEYRRYWFHLSLNSYINFEFIACSFSCLEHFAIKIYGIEFNKQNIGNFLQLNPQLKYLAFRYASVSAVLDSNNFENANEMFRDLQTLDLDLYENETANLYRQIIHLKKLKSLRVCFDFLDLTKPLNFPFATDCLESLTIHVNDFNYIHADIYNLIVKNPTVKKITLCTRTQLKFNYARVSAALPLLEELCLLHFPVVSTVNEAVEVIQNFSALKKFQFVFERILVPELQNRLHDTWSSQISQVTSAALVNAERLYNVSLERLI